MVAGREDYCRPKFVAEHGRIDIEGGRHPVGEMVLQEAGGTFIANSVQLQVQSR